MSKQLCDEIQHLYTGPLPVRMVRIRILFFMIICGLQKCEQTIYSDRKISISCYEKATKLIKTLYSDMKNLEKQYQRIEKGLRIMGKKYTFLVDCLS